MVTLEIAVVVLLTLLNGVFAMSELAVVSSRRTRLQQLSDEGHKGARLALDLQEDPSRFLATVQIGITLIGTLNGAYGGNTLGIRLGTLLDGVPVLTGYGYSIGLVIVISVITWLSLIIGELVPKRLALQHAESIAMLVARPMRALSRATAPLVWLLGVSTSLILRLLRVPEQSANAVTEEEVKSMIAEGTASGVFEPEERRMIEGVLRLSDRTVRSIMTPRLDVMWLDVDDQPDNIRQEIKDSGHSRFPVCRGDFDNVLGIVSARDLLRDQFEGRPLDIRAAMHDALVVHDGTPAMRVLEIFKQSRQQLAVVADEYGTIEGIVTLTDVLEAIAGELPQIGDTDAEADVVRRADGSLLIEGLLAVEEVEAVLHLRSLRDSDGDYHTLAGFILFKLGHIPKAGESFDHDGWRFEVMDMDGRRVDKVLLTPLTFPDPRNL
jgi:putative hemolysin